jgi:hypothetical protein
MENEYYGDNQINTENGYNGQFETSTGVTSDYNSFNFEHDAGLPIALGGVIVFFMLFIMIAIYVYCAVVFQRMARKLNIADDWFAWIPVLNLVLLLRIANRPLWWIVLLFIPIVNVITNIIVWMDVSKGMGKPEWWGVLMIFPGVNLVVMGYLAFSDSVGTPQNIRSYSSEDEIPTGAIIADESNTDFSEAKKVENAKKTQAENSKKE